MKEEYIIEFKEIKLGSIKKTEKEWDFKECQHYRVSVTPGSPYLQCRDCKKDVDAMWWLVELAKRENYAGLRYESLSETLNELKETIKSKNKFHCEHCKKYSRIDRTI